MSLSPSVSREWSHELDHRIESLFLSRCCSECFITTYAQDRCEHAGICTYHMVIDVPGIDSKSLLLIHRAPCIRSLEPIDIQQAFIHDCKCIGHRPAILLADLDSELFLRQNDIRCINQRFQYRSLIHDFCSLDSIKPDRLIIKGLTVRLEHCCMNIEVRSHILCHLHSVSGLLLSRRRYPMTGNHPRTVFNGKKNPSSGRFRKIDSGSLPYFILVLVHREGQDGGTF